MRKAYNRAMIYAHYKAVAEGDKSSGVLVALMKARLEAEDSTHPFVKIGCELITEMVSGSRVVHIDLDQYTGEEQEFVLKATNVTQVDEVVDLVFKEISPGLPEEADDLTDDYNNFMTFLKSTHKPTDVVDLFAEAEIYVKGSKDV